MDFFDKLSEKSQSLANSAKDTIEITRIKNNINREERNKEEVFAQIGKKYYELYANEAGEDFFEFIQKIEKIDSLILEYNKQIAEVKGEKVCPSCGALLEKEAIFCDRCGTRVEEEK